jgi:carbonic anhydrase
MHRLIHGVLHFQQQIYKPQEDLFQMLAKGQSPHTLFIACSDSRIDPNLITNSKPGDLFVVRNPGNLVAPHGTPSDAGAAVEFALANFNIQDLVVCGHTGCGAMRGLLEPRQLAALPTLAGWLKHAEQVRRRLAGRQDLDDNAWLIAAAEQNALVQIEHLRTYPIVEDRLKRSGLRLHAWVYHLQSGNVVAHHPDQDRYVPLTDTGLADAIIGRGR